MCVRFGTARKGKRRVKDGRGEKTKGKEERGGLRRGEEGRGRTMKEDLLITQYQVCNKDGG